MVPNINMFVERSVGLFHLICKIAAEMTYNVSSVMCDLIL